MKIKYKGKEYKIKDKPVKVKHGDGVKVVLYPHVLDINEVDPILLRELVLVVDNGE